MARTSSPKPKKRRSRRTRAPGKKKLNNTIPRFRNLGGHLIDPPDYCPKSRKAEDGSEWVDLYFCRSCEWECERYDEFNKWSFTERQADCIERGVIPTTEWKG